MFKKPLIAVWNKRSQSRRRTPSYEGGPAQDGPADPPAGDARFAWGCAARLLVVDEDRGPRATHVGGRAGRWLVDRREALVGV